MMSVTSQIFFDKPGVIARMDKKTARVLSSTGAFSRTVMKRGMRKRKKVSPPGGYPHSHAGQLRDLIFFGYDASSKSVVVGPTLFRSDRELNTSKTVPQLLNEGGSVVRVRKTGRGRKTRAIAKPQRQTYRPRPFVDLTLPVAAKKLADNMEKFAY